MLVIFGSLRTSCKIGTFRTSSEVDSKAQLFLNSPQAHEGLPPEPRDERLSDKLKVVSQSADYVDCGAPREAGAIVGNRTWAYRLQRKEKFQLFVWNMTYAPGVFDITGSFGHLVLANSHRF